MTLSTEQARRIGLRGGRAAGARRVALWAMVGSSVVAEIGLGWDIRWHLLIGRDSFWIPPHVMIYTSVAVAALIALGRLLVDTVQARAGRPLPGGIRLLGLVGTPGFHLAWWGIALTILAAPIDDLWHRRLGVDVTLWSPPHLLGVAGGDLHGLGLILIARESWPAGHPARFVAVLVNAVMLLLDVQTLTDPALLTAFSRGGVFFFTYSILGGLGFTFVLALTTGLTAARSTPLLVAAGAAVLHLVIVAVADVGLAVLQPVSVIDEVIAADPTSDIALSHDMAGRDGLRPGPSLILRALPLPPAAVMALVDGRRRWPAASLSFGGALCLASGVLLARAPSLSHALPGAQDIVVGLILTMAASLAGGWCASRLAGSAVFRRPGPAPE